MQRAHGPATLPPEAAHPPRENHMPGNHVARLRQAYRGPKEQLTVAPSPDWQDPPTTPLPKIFLVRDFGEEEGPQQAYALLNSKTAIEMKHRHPKWGCVLFGVIYERVGSSRSFRCPAKPKYVAIKRLDKRVVHRYLALGGPENPYKEVARMEALGDNEHVLRCIEFLEDDNYLYIVTPKACAEGTLKDTIAWGIPEEIMEPARIHHIFCKILQNLGYLERFGINHRDLSPDNFLFLDPDTLVVFDFAMSVRIPFNPQTGTRTLIAPQGRFGTLPFMAPEIYSNQEYDGVATDLWGASMILYCLLTNQFLYREPTVLDISYRYWIAARGLSSEPLNERARGLFERIASQAHRGSSCHATWKKKLIHQARAHISLSEDAVSLFQNVLTVDPAQRWTLGETMVSSFVENG